LAESLLTGRTASSYPPGWQNFEVPVGVLIARRVARPVLLGYAAAALEIAGLTVPAAIVGHDLTPESTVKLW
jgi:hypothetical protein